MKTAPEIIREAIRGFRLKMIIEARAGRKLAELGFMDFHARIHFRNANQLRGVIHNLVKEAKRLELAETKQFELNLTK